ncbi:MAG: DUF805 domain-containing protein [Pseudomonadota bacterium]
MGPVAAITSAFRQTFVVSGVATRAEFWWFAGLCAAVASAMHYLDSQLWGWTFKDGAEAHILFYAFVILFSLPLATAAIRRMQDVGFNGTLVFLPLLAEVVRSNAHSMMFDWFRLTDIRIGHPESENWVRTVTDLTDWLIPLSWGAVGVLALLPSKFAARFSKNSGPNAEVPQ